MTTIADTLPTQSNLDFSDAAISDVANADTGSTGSLLGTTGAQTGNIVNINIEGYCPAQDGSSAATVDSGMIDKMVLMFQSFMENIFKLFTTLIQTITQSLLKAGQTTTGQGTTTTGQTGNPTTGTTNGTGTTTGTTGTTPTTTPTTTPPATKDLTVSNDAKGLPQVKTDDGYLVSFDGKDQAWTITDPTGIATRIWGDPHVNESDGDKWDFKNNSSFKFGKNKITVETVAAGNGQTYTKALHIYSGDQRVSVGGIDKNQVALIANAHDATKHDRSILDGDVFSRAADKKKGHEGHEAWHRTRKAA